MLKGRLPMTWAGGARSSSQWAADGKPARGVRLGTVGSLVSFDFLVSPGDPEKAGSEDP